MWLKTLSHSPPLADFLWRQHRHTLCLHIKLLLQRWEAWREQQTCTNSTICWETHYYYLSETLQRCVPAADGLLRLTPPLELCELIPPPADFVPVYNWWSRALLCFRQRLRRPHTFLPFFILSLPVSSSHTLSLGLLTIWDTITSFLFQPAKESGSGQIQTPVKGGERISDHLDSKSWPLPTAHWSSPLLSAGRQRIQRWGPLPQCLLCSPGKVKESKVLALLSIASAECWRFSGTSFHCKSSSLNFNSRL